LSRLAATALSHHTVGPLDLEIGAGTCVALWGASGAGKTLLLRALADLDPHGGDVWIDDLAQAEMTGPAWRRRVGYLPAESGWWALTVGDHFPDGAPAGLDGLGLSVDALGWDVERLSTGERQRLALLRLLAARPDVLLLDEPTANLDPDTTARVETLVARYREEHSAAVLWVSHDAEQRARVASRTLTIADGALL